MGQSPPAQHRLVAHPLRCRRSIPTRWPRAICPRERSSDVAEEAADRRPQDMQNVERDHRPVRMLNLEPFRRLCRLTNPSTQELRGGINATATLITSYRASSPSCAFGVAMLFRKTARPSSPETPASVYGLSGEPDVRGLGRILLAKEADDHRRDARLRGGGARDRQRDHPAFPLRIALVARGARKRVPCAPMPTKRATAVAGYRGGAEPGAGPVVARPGARGDPKGKARRQP